MKKLNNNGWGLNTFLIFLVIFILFIVIITILSYSIGIDNGSKNPITNIDNTPINENFSS